jgi:hypothetical protein
VVSANYHCAFLDSYSIELGTSLSRGVMIGQSAGEKLAKMTSRNHVYWSYFRINRVKTLIVNLISLEPLKFFKTISGFSLGLDLSNHI